MKSTLVLILLTTTIIMSCGEKEKREKALKSLEQNQKLKEDFEVELAGASNRLKAFEQQMAVAQDKLNRVKQFQMLRTEQERDQQIKNAVAETQRIVDDMESARLKILALTDSVSVAERRISAAKEIIKD